MRLIMSIMKTNMVAAVLATLLVLVLAASVVSAAPSSNDFSLDDAVSGKGRQVYFRGKPVPLPSLETVLGQDFDVSVVTESYGVFNATLRVRSSVTFPERLHGELIPHGEVSQTRASTVILPHFKRLRTPMDDRYSEIPLASGVLPKARERPTLLVFDMLLERSNSPQGSLSVYYLPAEESALETTQEALQEGSLSAVTVATFEFRDERDSMATPPLRAIAPLARTASNTFARFPPSRGGSAGDDADAPAGPHTQGDFTFRLFSEHEFWCHLRIPPAPQADGTSSPSASLPLENVWLAGYTKPSKAVLNRNTERPWYAKYSVFILGGMAFVIQIISGVSDGWKKWNAEEARANAAVRAAPAPQAVKEHGKKKN